MKTGITAALAAAVLLIIGGVVFREDLWDFIRAMRPVKPRAELRFGKALDPGGRSVVDPATTFYLGENVAWVVSFEKGIGVKEVMIVLSEVTGDGREIPLDRNLMKVEPTDTGLYNFTSTRTFWSLSPDGMNALRHIYRVKYIKDRVLAQGDFTIVADRQD